MESSLLPCWELVRFENNLLEIILNNNHNVFKGQQLLKRNPQDPDCCYYLHCANYNYPVTPDPKNDELNAEDFKNYYEGKPLMEQIHLIPSVTFPNLQQPENNSRILEQLKSKHQVRADTVVASKTCRPFSYNFEAFLNKSAKY